MKIRQLHKLIPKNFIKIAFINQPSPIIAPLTSPLKPLSRHSHHGRRYPPQASFIVFNIKYF